ncbi:RecQ family ATP-dependent DNA helicase [Heliophilum fasciatum]|uniref:DNA 3'-5' helicase n=1 Tax=Heliophilum fasciatum TaxID=35700 RepID=A0A4R2REV7_9FIRM|nr:RecQ family ATP-dependent DNA helicase [Heliophilum fasciatum]MCW2279211.1 ATP-dependent DNA helicase RecQ [Heliophilum fasciatum]TCP60799.1 RecQ-like ATP-dependent DNA helicase [Heliophilum fasciatum]
MKEYGLHLLREAYGTDANFKPDQWEAIEFVLRQVKSLVVQKTGWGKSLVYFLATKILRSQQGAGPTILISPLLALMRNQTDAASRLGINAVVMNSENPDEWDTIERELHNDCIDLLLITPERLGNQRFIGMLRELTNAIGLFVVDEAHCISDWGHDFRPDYRRIVRLIQGLAPNIPVLATTATANDRVVADIREQLGEELQILRGPLMRESLCLQVMHLPTQEERLAWLAQYVPTMPHSGIIYCSTITDCRRVAQWLQLQGIAAYEYHSRLHDDNEENRRLRIEREHQLMNNKIKVLVSTIALGMGFDKQDLGFVIHYQTPMNLVNYYQQIGRAGRGLNQAYAILLVGNEDEEIQKHMINTAFPTLQNMGEVLQVVENADEGLTLNSILSAVNQSKSSVEKCLKFLELDQAIYKERRSTTQYLRSINPWYPDVARMNQVTANRYREWEKIKQYQGLDSCYMSFIARELNDPYAHDCGKCSNCTGAPLFPEEISSALRLEAIDFLRGSHIVIHPRKMWPIGGAGTHRGRIAATLQNQPGRALCVYNDSGYGPLVRSGKYVDHHFPQELVTAAAAMITQKWCPQPSPTWVTCVPSRREPTLVSDYARRLAASLDLPFLPILIKPTDTEPQKNMENSQHKAANIVNAFQIAGSVPSGPVLLVDDVVDSRWTFTVCGVQLLQAGSGPVYPFALADASRGGDVD